jgi:hypothetical protein
VETQGSEADHVLLADAQLEELPALGEGPGGVGDAPQAAAVRQVGVQQTEIGAVGHALLEATRHGVAGGGLPWGALGPPRRRLAGQPVPQGMGQARIARQGGLLSQDAAVDRGIGHAPVPWLQLPLGYREAAAPGLVGVADDRAGPPHGLGLEHLHQRHRVMAVDLEDLEAQPLQGPARIADVLGRAHPAGALPAVAVHQDVDGHHPAVGDGLQRLPDLPLLQLTVPQQHIEATAGPTGHHARHL